MKKRPGLDNSKIKQVQESESCANELTKDFWRNTYLPTISQPELRTVNEIILT